MAGRCAVLVYARPDYAGWRRAASPRGHTDQLSWFVCRFLGCVSERQLDSILGSLRTCGSMISRVVHRGGGFVSGFASSIRLSSARAGAAVRATHSQSTVPSAFRFPTTSRSVRRIAYREALPLSSCYTTLAEQQKRQVLDLAQPVESTRPFVARVPSRAILSFDLRPRTHFGPCPCHGPVIAHRHPSIRN